MSFETFQDPDHAITDVQTPDVLEPRPLAPDEQSTGIGQQPVQREPEEWGYTTRGEHIARLRQARELQRGGESAVRHSIHRDSPIAEGVYEGAYGGEAIVVDYDKDPTLIDETVEEVLRGAVSPETGKIDKNRILLSVFDTVSRRMPYDAAAVEDIFQRGLGGKHQKKVSLSYYIQEGAGECRHQALYTGVVLERIKAMGYISGTPSVDRNMIKSGADGKYDGHAWVRYTNSGGEVFILDIAQQTAGTLKDLMKNHQLNPASTWDYARPEDTQKYTDEVLWGKQPFTDQHPIARPNEVDLSPYMDENGVIYKTPWST